VLELAMTCALPYAERIVKQEKGKETIYDLQFGARAVKLPGHSQPLTLVVVRGFGQEPLMLLTDLRVTRSRKSLWRILESYLTRWRIEETIRFMKQSYQVEDIRLLTYHRLQNMMAILTAVAYFAMVYLGLRTKLKVLARHVIGAARRVFGIPDFHFYALAAMVFVSTFSDVRRAYRPFFNNGLKNTTSYVSSIHKFLGELQGIIQSKLSSLFSLQLKRLRFCLYSVIEGLRKMNFSNFQSLTLY